MGRPCADRLDERRADVDVAAALALPSEPLLSGTEGTRGLVAGRG
jgi:hypothetical protein